MRQCVGVPTLTNTSLFVQFTDRNGMQTILIKGHNTVPLDFRNPSDIISILEGHYSHKQSKKSQEYATP